MKLSKYNKIIELNENKTVSFNSLTTNFSEVDHRFKFILENINEIKYEDLEDEYKEIFDKMKQGGYIISDDVDELQLLELRNLQGRFAMNSVGMTIAPTMDCNFGCSYCFEERKSGKMSNEVIEKVYELVESETKKGNAIGVTWFGGEPMMAFELIKEMSHKFMKICKNNNVSYNASIVSNGYLLDLERVKELKELMISGIQVTLDGPARIHDERRHLLNKKPTFDKIISNLRLLKDEEINATIRVNLDKNNIDDLSELFDVLKEKNLDSLNIDFGHIKVFNKACSSLDNKCLSGDMFSEKYRELSKILKSKGFNVSLLYPKLRRNFCGADRYNSYVIDPLGNTYKCWNDIGFDDRITGNLFGNHEQVNRKLLLDYATHSALKKEKCRECFILPVCMGGCVYESLMNDEPSCEKWKYGLEKYLEDVYYNLKAEQK